MAKVTEKAPATEQPEYLTIKRIAAYTGFDVAKIRAAIKAHAAFKGEGIVREREIPDTDYPPIKEIKRTAVDTWVEALKTSAAGGAGGTRVRGEGKRYLVRLPVADLNNTTATLTVGDTVYTVTLEQAFKRKAAAIADAPAASPQAAAIDALIPDAETVSA